MSHEHAEVLTCEEHGCAQEVYAPASQLVGRARAAGWQAREVISLTIDPEDGPHLQLTDRCPGHHVQTVPREAVLDQAGGPGGIQAWMLP